MFKEFLGEALPIIEKAAPLIAHAVIGPYAGTAVMALSLVAKAFGVENFDLKSVVEAINNDPEAESKLSGLQTVFGEQMKSEWIKLLPSSAELNIKMQWDKINN